MIPDLNRLKVFYHVYTQESVVAAAAEMHLSQPAISQQLQKLEAELKVLLFTRLHKKLIPTTAGIRLFHVVKPFIDELQKEIDIIRQPLDRPAGPLRIGAPKVFGKEYLPQFCSTFREKYREVTFELKFDEPAPLLAMLKEGKLDFALVDIFQGEGKLWGDSRYFSIEPLIREKLILACSHKYYNEEIHADHSFANLAQKDYVSDDGDLMFLSQWFKHHFGKAPKKLNIAMKIDSHEALVSSVKMGIGLGLISAHLVWDEISDGSIVAIHTAVQNMVNHISLIQLQDKIPTLTEKTFLDHLRKQMKNEEVQKRFDRVKGSQRG